jgi:FixJ family two-component response regulator
MLGLEALHHFVLWKEQSALNNINDELLIIGISSTADAEEQCSGLKDGMHFFARKPVDNNILKSIISLRIEKPLLSDCITAIEALNVL